MMKSCCLKILFWAILLFPNTDLCAQRFLVKDKYQQEALREMFKEARSGNVESMYLAGKCYILGKMVEKDEKLGLQYILKACEKGYARAWEERADLENNEEKALEYYQRSIELYNEKDKYCTNKEAVLDVIYRYANIYNKDNPQKAIPLYMFAAKYGHESSMAKCALFFWENKETYNQTYKYLVALSEKENEIGFWGLGEMYYYGQYVKKDIALAIKWYEKAANKGDFLSQQMLGNLYYDGDMTEQNFSKAFEYCRMSVYNKDRSYDSGMGEVMHKLAACYRFGRGTTANATMANLWETLAAWFSSTQGEDALFLTENIDVEQENIFMVSTLRKFYTITYNQKYIASKIVNAFYKILVLKEQEGVTSLLDLYSKLEQDDRDKYFLGYFLTKVFDEVNVHTDTSESIRKFISTIEVPNDFDRDKELSFWFDELFIRCIKQLDKQSVVLKCQNGR